MLKLPPDAFWRMTPREIAAAARGLFGTRGAPPALARSELDALMARFPDEEPQRDATALSSPLPGGERSAQNAG